MRDLDWGRPGWGSEQAHRGRSCPGSEGVAKTAQRQNKNAMNLGQCLHCGFDKWEKAALWKKDYTGLIFFVCKTCLCECRHLFFFCPHPRRTLANILNTINIPISNCALTGPSPGGSVGILAPIGVLWVPKGGPPASSVSPGDSSEMQILGLPPDLLRQNCGGGPGICALPAILMSAGVWAPPGVWRGLKGLVMGGGLAFSPCSASSSAII